MERLGWSCPKSGNADDCQQTTKGMKSALGETHPANTWILDFCLQNRGEYISVVGVTQCGALCYGSPSKPRAPTFSMQVYELWWEWTNAVQPALTKRWTWDQNALLCLWLIVAGFKYLAHDNIMVFKIIMLRERSWAQKITHCRIPLT